MDRDLLRLILGVAGIVVAATVMLALSLVRIAGGFL